MQIQFQERMIANRKRLHQILTHAENHVPYWRDTFKKCNFKPEDVLHDKSALELLPYMTKDTVREQGSRLYDERKGTPKHPRRTGGSTGISVFYFYDQTGLDWTAAANLYALSLAGKDPHHSEAHFGTLFAEEPPLKARIIEWLKCLSLNRTSIKINSFDTDGLAQSWQKLMKVKPMMVQGHPSTIYALALLVERSQGTGKNVFSVFESTGETLDETKRAKIEEIFGCATFNRYGTAEFGVIAHETKQSRFKAALKVIDPMFMVENAPTEEGLNELVISGLTNTGMPMFRYKQGDIGTVTKEEDGYYINNIQGRIHDTVPIGENLYPTHYIQDLLDNRTFTSVDDFQIIMRPGKRPEFRLVVPNDEIRPKITKILESWWGDNITIRYIDLSQLILSGWRQKRRYVVWLNMPGNDIHSPANEGRL